MSSDFAFSESAELGWKIGHKNRNGEEFVICFRDESCKYFLKKKANKDSFNVGREGKCENCKYFLEKSKTKNQKTLTILVERISWKLQKKMRKKTKTLSMLEERRNVRLPKAESGRKGSLKPVAVYF